MAALISRIPMLRLLLTASAAPSMTRLLDGSEALSKFITFTWVTMLRYFFILLPFITIFFLSLSTMLPHHFACFLIPVASSWMSFCFVMTTSSVSFIHFFIFWCPPLVTWRYIVNDLSALLWDKGKTSNKTKNQNAKTSIFKSLLTCFSYIFYPKSNP